MSCVRGCWEELRVRWEMSSVRDELLKGGGSDDEMSYVRDEFCESALCVVIFLLQALHGIKSNRVTSKSTDINLPTNKQTNHKKYKKRPSHQPSDSNPPSQDWSLSGRRKHQGASKYQRGGKPALNNLPNKNCPSVQAKAIQWIRHT